MENLLKSVLGSGKRGPVIGFSDNRFVLVVRTLPGKYVELVEADTWDNFVKELGEYAKEYDIAVVDDGDVSEPIELPEDIFPPEPVKGNEEVEDE